MAFDFSLTLNPTLTDGLQLPPFSSGRLAVFQTTSGGGNPGEVTVTTSELTLSFGTITPGPVLLYNLDITNYVEWGVATGVYRFRLDPRLASNAKACPHWVVLQSGSIFLRANTATCKILVLGWNP